MQLIRRFRRIFVGLILTFTFVIGVTVVYLFISNLIQDKQLQQMDRETLSEQIDSVSNNGV